MRIKLNRCTAKNAAGSGFLSICPLRTAGGTDAGKACCLIKRFWLEHNGETQTDAEARADLCAWTAEGHRFFFILPKDGAELNPVGFAHLGSRGAAADWLEDLFILPEFQGRGIGSEAIKLLESTVKQYSESMYIEAAAAMNAQFGFIAGLVTTA